MTRREYQDTLLFKQENLVDDNDSEPCVWFYDNVITQNDVDIIHPYDMTPEELQELSANILTELRMANPEQFRRYTEKNIVYPMVTRYTYDTYPVPFAGPTESGLTIAACFAKSWNKNWGGEFMTFHQTEPEDIISTYPGRVFVLEGTAWCKISQPNVNAKENLDYLFFRLVN